VAIRSDPPSGPHGSNSWVPPNRSERNNNIVHQLDFDPNPVREFRADIPHEQHEDGAQREHTKRYRRQPMSSVQLRFHGHVIRVSRDVTRTKLTRVARPFPNLFLHGKRGNRTYVLSPNMPVVSPLFSFWLRKHAPRQQPANSDQDAARRRAELLMPGSAPSVVRFTKQAEQKIEHEHHTDCIDSNTEWKYRHRLPRTSAESASSEDKVTALALPRHKRLISSS